MSNLPAGVTDNMIPGNTPEDREWDGMLDAINDDAELLLHRVGFVLSKSRYHHNNRATRQALLRDSLGITR